MDFIALNIGYAVLAVVILAAASVILTLVRNGYKAIGHVRAMIAWSKQDTADHALHWNKVGFFSKARQFLATWWNLTWDTPDEVTMTLKDGRSKTIVTK